MRLKTGRLLGLAALAALVLLAQQIDWNTQIKNRPPVLTLPASGNGNRLATTVSPIPAANICYHSDGLGNIVPVPTSLDCGAGGGGGATGPTGAGYYATSSSLRAILAGNQTFVVQTGLAYSTASRVRIAWVVAPTTTWMEGPVVSYSGNTLVVNVDAMEGSGLLTPWDISLIGTPGRTGPQGITGPTGSGGEPTIAGTASQIAVAGPGCSAAAGLCTISIPASPIFTTPNIGAAIGQSLALGPTGPITAGDITGSDASSFPQVVNVKAYGAVGDGSHDDTAAIQAAIDAAFGPAGSPHTSATAYLNKVLYFPPGHYKISGAPGVLFTYVIGARIIGSGRFTTTIENTTAGGTVLTTNGLSYSLIEGMAFKCSGACIDVDLDWDAGGASAGLQSNTFIDDNFGGATFNAGSIGVRIGHSAHMGSENTFLNDNWITLGTGITTQSFNALNNKLVNGDIQDTAIGVHAAAGSVSVNGTSFETGHQELAGTWDILADTGSAWDQMAIRDIRTENCFFFHSGVSLAFDLNSINQVQTNCQGGQVNENLVIQNAAGSGYVGGNVVTIVGGNSDATISLDTVDGSGVPQTWHVVARGTGYSADIGTPLATSGGGGTGFKVIVPSVGGELAEISQGAGTIQNVQALSTRVIPRGPVQLTVQSSKFWLADWLSTSLGQLNSIAGGSQANTNIKLHSILYNNTGGNAFSGSISDRIVVSDLSGNGQYGTLLDHLITLGTVPGISGCGAGGTISANSTDEGGTVTLGTAPGSCVITFATAYITNAPKCTISFQAGIPVGGAYTVSTSALTLIATGITGKVDYRCAQ